MSQVVDFPGAHGERQIWVCSCGCRSFSVFAGGEIECAACGVAQNGAPGGWREKLPDAPAKAGPVGADTHVHVVTLLDARAFLTRLLRDPVRLEEINAVVATRSSGALHTWGHDFSGAEARAWLDRRLAEAREILTK